MFLADSACATTQDAMIRAISRVLYRADWATKRPDIMRKHGWTRCPGEVLVSTPRRFGKVRRKKTHTDLGDRTRDLWSESPAS